ncbi:MAG TPA: hypothetical protein DCP11_06530 [Microbacteriaceae bacterium]|jgi:hypothetical protein|nr:hypothetical protein [Microbacteriaceae bacterium]
MIDIIPSQGLPGARLRVRVSLAHSEPEIWRLLELDASLPLDRVHQVLQAAFQWRDVHLHAFSDDDPDGPRRARAGLRVIPRRWMSQDLLDDGQPGLLETESTIGEALSVASGVLFYEYDFGDGWTHRLELLEAFPATTDAPPALLVRGEQRGPLEDSGGVDRYAELLGVLADPLSEEHPESAAWASYIAGPWHPFDPDRLNVDDVNRELRLLFEPEAPRTLVGILTERLYPGVRGEFRSYLAEAMDGPAEVDAATAERMVRPYAWLLHRIGIDGLQLSAAGWLPPAVVRDAMRELEWEGRWIGAMNREDRTMPILQLRASAQRLGIIRKVKGRLVLNSYSKKDLGNPAALWSRLATLLVLRNRHESRADAAMLLAIAVASGRHSSRRDYLEPLAFGLGALGWTTEDGEDLPDETVNDLIDETWRTLLDLGVFERDARGLGVTGVTEEGRAFARAMLRV